MGVLADLTVSAWTSLLKLAIIVCPGPELEQIKLEQTQPLSWIRMEKADNGQFETITSLVLVQILKQSIFKVLLWSTLDRIMRMNSVT